MLEKDEDLTAFARSELEPHERGPAGARPKAAPPLVRRQNVKEELDSFVDNARNQSSASKETPPKRQKRRMDESRNHRRREQSDGEVTELITPSVEGRWVEWRGLAGWGLRGSGA